MEGTPRTLYGVYKRANEGTATVFADEKKRDSTGTPASRRLRPGRDQGLTSRPHDRDAPRGAGLPYKLAVRRRLPTLQYAPDVARTFIEAAKGRATGGPPPRTIGGAVSHTDEVIEAITAAAPGAEITYERVLPPIPERDGRHHAGHPAARGRRRRDRAVPRSA
jgi:hypothetical protein